MRVVKRLLAATFLWVLALPVGLIILGAASNQVAMISNGGSMPVLVNATRLARFEHERRMEEIKAKVDGTDLPPLADGMLDARHSVMTPETHLKVLCDLFDADGIESIGDFAIELGMWLWIFFPYVWGTLICLKVLTYEL